jgi:hypothetical protein
MNFGPDMSPDGSFLKKVGIITSEALYKGFAPATEFKFGFALEPVTTPWLSTLLDIELAHPADNLETFRIGGEAVLLDMLALRIGRDNSADEMKTSLGIGAAATLGERRAQFDYAATLTDHLGTIHRFSITLGF